MTHPYPETWWLPVTGRLTPQQLAAIGSVVTEWSVLDIQLQTLLCEMAQSPDTFGQALTNELGPDNRLKALDRLVETWRTIMRPEMLARHQADLDEVAAILKWVKVAKGLRNQIAHWAWIRTTDEALLGFKFTTQPRENGSPSLEMTVLKISEFATEINHWAYRATAATSRLRNFPAFPRGAPTPKRARIDSETDLK